MSGTEGDLTELFVRGFKCTGDVPPALVGSSVTYLSGQAYVFGGRALHSGKLSNDIYTCDLQTYKWRCLEAVSSAQPPAQQPPAQQPSEQPVEQPQHPGHQPTQKPQPRAERSDMAPPPPARFFHSATAFRHYLIVFGGMGLDVDPDAPIGPSTVSDMRSTNIQDDRNQQSFQVRTSKTLLGDMAVFDTLQECWVARRVLDSDVAATEDARPESAAAAFRPSPRYAHLSTLLGSRLLVVGGQDLEEQYVEELNVFDLQLGRWVLRSPFPRAVGLYRSFIANVPSSGNTLLYSNYSFAAVKRALYLLSSPPDCTLKEISDQLDGEPPGLRFPRGHLVDPHTVLMSGTLISTEGHSEMSLWALDSKTLLWKPVNCGAKFRTGSWNQSIVDPRTNTLVVFGDSRRDLNYDYQRRRLNYTEVRAIDLRALGYQWATQPPELPATITANPLAAARTAAAGGTLAHQPSSPSAKLVPGLLGFEIGSQLMYFSQFSDAEVIAADGTCVTEVNTGLIRARWPKQTQTWLAAGVAQSPTGPPSRDSHTDGDPRRPSSSPTGGFSAAPDGAMAALGTDGVRRLVIDGSREAINVLVFFLYTGVVDPSARFGLHQGAETAAAAAAKDEVSAVRVLGELLILATKYSIDALVQRTSDMLRWKATGTTAPLIFEAALRAEDQGLQARSVIAVKDHIAGLRADRQSTLYTISSTARASIMRYFPKVDAVELSNGHGDISRPSMAQDRAYQQHYQANNAFATTVPAPNPRQLYQADSRQRSTSDALMAAAAAAADTAGSTRNGAFPSPPSSSNSPVSTIRGSQTRSPYQQHDMANPRRPWDATTMGSPVINSPSSSRYSGQSPEIRGGGSTLVDSSSINSGSNKRLSGISHLANQPLPEDATVDYSHDGSSTTTTVSDTMPQMHAPSSSKSKRTSRYLGGIGGAAAASSVESVAVDRRPSDTSSLNDVPIHSHHQQQQQQQQVQPQPPQQQQQQQQSSRSLIFRPWNKMKKIASSSQVGTDSPTPPPVPAHSSTFSGSSSR